jgi:hypothetical protein
METYASYLKLLNELSHHLERMSALAREKADAVHRDDLNQLDRVLKQEQAMSLTIRGLEEKRQKTLEQLKLTHVPLSQLAQRYPKELRLEAVRTVEELRRQYQVYRSAAEVARNALECGLHEIGKVLNSFDAATPDGPGYQNSGAELPSQMKTDFRA